ncbi:MAG TPA: DnaB-like helicase N-terminal domain-containing protein, partial [Erysipelothrix sp.]|nr:DnaB-like helicase N-terminal domain-containing protein [Erysipelothrix sp.]
MTLRQLPQSVEAEVALLGTLLVYPETTRTVAQYGLVPRDFYDAKHRLLFEAMMEVIESDVLLDVTTLISKLNDKGIFNEVGGMEYLVHLTDGSGSPASLDYYVDIVQEKSQKRNLIETSQRIAEISFDGSTDVQELLDRAEKSIQEIAQSRRTEEMQKGPDVVDAVYQQIKDFGESG